MEMRPTEVIARNPFGEHDVKAGLRWVARDHRLRIAGALIHDPLDVLGHGIDHGLRVELDGVRAPRRECNRRQNEPDACHACLPFVSSELPYIEAAGHRSPTNASSARLQGVALGAAEAGRLRLRP